MSLIQKRKKKIAVAIVSAGSFLPLQANAGIPVIDPTAIAQIISQTAQQASNFASEMAMYAKQMAQDIQLNAQKMRNDFNRSVMEVGNITQVDTDLHNIYMLAELQPIRDDACVLMTTTQHSEKMKQTSEGLTSQGIGATTRRNIPNIGEKPDNLITSQDYKLSMFDRMLTLSETENSSISTGNSETESGYERLLDPTNMFVENMDREQYMLALFQKDLLAGSPPETGFSSYNLNGVPYKKEYVERSRREIIRNFALYSIHTTIDKRFAGNSGSQGVSEIGAVEEFLNETIRNPDWVVRYTNTNPDTTKATSSAQALRMLVGIEAKRLELDLMSYRQQEEIKTLTAINTLLESGLRPSN